MTGSLVVRVGDLLRDPGSRRKVERDVHLGALGTTAASVASSDALSVDVDLASMATGDGAGGLELTGTVRFAWSGSCRRCLDAVEGRSEVPFRELAQRTPMDDDVYEIDGDLLDIEPMVRELVLASLPLAPICGPDCVGPDPDRYPTAPETERPDADSSDGERPVDPRWSALSELDLG